MLSIFSLKERVVKTRTLFAIVTVVVSIALFRLGPHAPLEIFWSPSPDNEKPTGAQLPLFILLSVFKAVAAGIGTALLILGCPMVKAIAPASKGLAHNLTRLCSGRHTAH